MRRLSNSTIRIPCKIILGNPVHAHNHSCHASDPGAVGAVTRVFADPSPLPCPYSSVTAGQEAHMPPRARLRRHRQTKIVATLGPASCGPDMIARLFRAGADVFRLNFSHGSHADHAANVAAVRGLERETGRSIGLLADVQGPKLRVGRFAGGSHPPQYRADVHVRPGPDPGQRPSRAAAASRDPGSGDQRDVAPA